MTHLLAIFLQDTTGEETTEGIAKQAAEAAQDTSDKLSGFSNFFSNILGYLTSLTFLTNVAAALIVVVLAIFFYKLFMRLVPRVLRGNRPENEDALDASTLAAIKRRDTAITLIRNTLRYVFFAIATLFILSIFLNDLLPGIAGASILAAVVGFGAQSFLRDIIAGFSILFEGQYSVGDFIEVEPMKAAGMVEEFGLRTTKIRSPSGEVIYVANGTITSVRNYVSGQQRFTIEVQLKSEEAANRVLEEMAEGHELYLVPPRLVERNETPEGGPRLRLLAGVLPSTAWLVEENLVERIRSAAGEDGLAGDPLVYKIDRQNVRRLRDFIPPEQ